MTNTMNRRTILKTAAGAAAISSINLFLEGNAMAQETAARTDADAILERLMTHDVPAAVQYDDRMRTLITVASLTAQDEAELLERIATDALKRGIDPLAMREAAMQAMAYSGLPTTIRALGALEKACAAAGKPFPTAASATVTDADRFEKGLAVQTGIFGDAITTMHKTAKADERAITVDLLTGFCFGDTYTRTGLTLKERELLTFVVIASMGGCEPQVKAHANGNLLVGNTRQMLIDAIVVMIPFIGFPKSLNALAMLNEAAPSK